MLLWCGEKAGCNLFVVLSLIRHFTSPSLSVCQSVFEHVPLVTRLCMFAPTQLSWQQLVVVDQQEVGQGRPEVVPHRAAPSAWRGTPASCTEMRNP